MKSLALFFSLILTQTCLAQLKVTKLDKNSVPKSIQYKGGIVEAVQWPDSTGDNIVILAATDKTPSRGPVGGRDAALYAYHYLVSGDGVKQTWKVYDYIQDCDVDIDLYFVDNTFAVTDLNKDGRAEVWIMYKNFCHGDVSPVPMKIIMYHGNEKLAVRGTTRVPSSENEYAGGEFTFDDAFKRAPAEFRQYAQKLWKQHGVETWKQ